jgi:FKBP-type peptidyl-prolyl cis-trans isomerase SlyD
VDREKTSLLKIRTDSMTANLTKLRWGIILMGILFFACSAQAKGDEVKKETIPVTVTSGEKISIEYTLTLENKEVADTNVGREPLTFEQGSHQIIPGLEKAIEGMKVGENRKVTIKPEDAYGPVVKEAVIEVNKDKLPSDALKVDAQVQAKSPEGQVLVGRVTEIKGDKAVVDFNHPMAGKTLFFDVKVLTIEKAP